MILAKTKPFEMVSVPLMHLKAILKLLSFFLLALIFIAHHQLMWWFLPHEKTRLSVLLKSINFYCRLTVKLLSIDVKSSGSLCKLEGKLVVSNHLSYIDALVVYSQLPCLFVTSVEIQKTFLLGQLTALSGCFFVERRKELRTEERKLGELNSIRSRLDQGFNVFLFPEGTSSDGKTVLPFKAHFFQVAMDAKSTIQPVVLKYEGESSDLVPWYGKMTFADHLYDLCLQSNISAKVTILPEVSSENFQDKFLFANHVQSLIKDSYE